MSASTSSTKNIKSWLDKSREVRQQRVKQLAEFGNFIDSKSETPTDIQSPFLKKYKCAQLKLDQLQRQINEFRLSSPPTTKRINCHFFPSDDQTSDAPKRMNKSKSARITISSPPNTASNDPISQIHSHNLLKPPPSSTHKSKRKSPRKLSFASSPIMSDEQSPINRVRQSILFEESEDDRASIFSSPRSPKSQRSPSIKSEFGSPKSAIFEICDESERILADRQVNIGDYRHSILLQLEKAQNQRESEFERRHSDNLALRFFESKTKEKIMAKWAEYTENELQIGHNYYANVVKSKCLSEWRRMCRIMRTIKKRKYVKIWRQSNCESMTSIRKLLSFPTKSRWHFLRIVSVLRLYKNSFGKRRSALLFDRLFNRNRSVILFVFMSSWRSLAQQRNIAAFNILTILQKTDKMKKIQTLKRWQSVTKKERMKRMKLANVSRQINAINIKKRHFAHWLNVFVEEANNKIALFFWCNAVELKAFNHWKECLIWSIHSEMRADKFYKMKIFARYFGRFVDKFVQSQNEKQWKKWREATKKPKNDIAMEQKKKYLCNVQSAEMDSSQNLFFPYCGATDESASKQKEVGMSYVTHCEVQKLLIPKYDKAMAEKYK